MKTLISRLYVTVLLFLKTGLWLSIGLVFKTMIFILGGDSIHFMLDNFEAKE